MSQLIEVAEGVCRFTDGTTLVLPVGMESVTDPFWHAPGGWTIRLKPGLNHFTRLLLGWTVELVAHALGIDPDEARPPAQLPPEAPC